MNNGYKISQNTFLKNTHINVSESRHISIILTFTIFILISIYILFLYYNRSFMSDFDKLLRSVFDKFYVFNYLDKRKFNNETFVGRNETFTDKVDHDSTLPLAFTNGDKREQMIKAPTHNNVYGNLFKNVQESQVKKLFKKLSIYENFAEKIKGKNDKEIINLLKNHIKIKPHDYTTSGDNWTAIQYKNLVNQVIPNFKVESYLDVGCGSGYRTVAISHAFGVPSDKTFGTDISEWITKFNRVEINFKEMKNGIIDFPDNSFNLISINMVLHHVHKEERNLFLSEINRVLKLNGILLVREHDVISEEDLAIIDIEHLLWSCLVHGDSYETFIEKYYSEYFSKDSLDKFISLYNFEKISTNYDRSKLPVNLSYLSIFKLNSKISNL